MKYKIFSEEKAVTPVVGVMLMVVVTVILAAAVSSYAGSMSAQDAAPQLTLKSSASMKDGFITLEHLGGDILTKDNVDIEIATGSPVTSGYVNMSNMTFMPESKYLRPGDTAKFFFVQNATFNKWEELTPGNYTGVAGTETMRGVFKGEQISLSVYQGTPFKMTLIDKNSGQTIYTTTVVMNP